MYCRNCGNPMDPNAAVCIRCGCAKGAGTSFCPNCGQPTVPGYAVCTSCGYGLTGALSQQGKSRIAAGVLGILLGSIGVHNFYLGYTGKAVAQLLITLLTCGAGSAITAIWGLVEGILLLCGEIKVDGHGIPLRD